MPMAGPHFHFCQPKAHRPLWPCDGSKVIQEELRYSLHENAASGGIAHAVSTPRKSQNLNVLPSIDQIVDHCERVREVHVVVAGAVSDEQFAFELTGIFHR